MTKEKYNFLGQIISEEKLNKDADIIVTNVFDYLSEPKINALRNTMKHYGISGKNYSINEERDEAECLIRNQDKWEVFFSERGNKVGKDTFDDLDSACISMLNNFAESDKEFTEMKEYFENDENHFQDGKYSYADLKNIIKNSLSKIAML